jgi:hypothetical protein
MSSPAASGDVCRVPLDDPANAPAVAAAFGGSYHESDCGFLQKCSSVHVQYTTTNRGADTRLATWYTCELDPWQSGVAVVALIAVALFIFFAVRRIRRSEDGRGDDRSRH